MLLSARDRLFHFQMRPAVHLDHTVAKYHAPINSRVAAIDKGWGFGYSASIAGRLSTSKAVSAA
jgi:hypothetical protein